MKRKDSPRLRVRDSRTGRFTEKKYIKKKWANVEFTPSKNIDGIFSDWRPREVEKKRFKTFGHLMDAFR